VLIHSSNLYPLGNCDSPGSETNPDYLTQPGAASHRPVLPSSLFAFTDGARTPPEELVNPACLVECVSTRLERGPVNQPDPTFPRSPGSILETVSSKLSSAFNHPTELWVAPGKPLPGLRLRAHPAA
jgi:hypothetical protein